MSHRLVIDGNAVYEIDEECLKDKKVIQKKEISSEENENMKIDKKTVPKYNKGV